MFYQFLVWCFSRPTGRAAKPGAVRETAFIICMFLILMLMKRCNG
jgi:hypothetical protein